MIVICDRHDMGLRGAYGQAESNLEISRQCDKDGRCLVCRKKKFSRSWINFIFLVVEMLLQTHFKLV